MSVIKIVELIGVSDQGFEAATQKALTEASKTIRNISGIHVKGFTCEVKDNKIVNYKANVKIAFLVER